MGIIADCFFSYNGSCYSFKGRDTCLAFLLPVAFPAFNIAYHGLVAMEPARTVDSISFDYLIHPSYSQIIHMAEVRIYQ